MVSINVSATTNYFGQTVQTAASGTGFFITEDGYILTNHHVISDASSVKVTLYNGETYDAKVIGSDEDYDIAVLKIDVTGATPVVLGDSSKVAIGESVAAVGNPLGELTFSMSEGIVSCVNRAINVDGTPFNMIQVDCSINPGNSGGPLFNSYGEVVGIVSAKYSSYSNTTVEGIGFAIPINDVVSLVKDIMTNGYVTNKAYMGITPQTMTAQMAQQYRYDVTEGVFVCSVDPDSAAAKAGLKLGDVITKMDDKDIASYEDLVAAKKSLQRGRHRDADRLPRGQDDRSTAHLRRGPRDRRRRAPPTRAPTTATMVTAVTATAGTAMAATATTPIPGISSITSSATAAKCRKAAKRRSLFLKRFRLFYFFVRGFICCA